MDVRLEPTAAELITISDRDRRGAHVHHEPS